MAPQAKFFQKFTQKCHIWCVKSFKISLKQGKNVKIPLYLVLSGFKTQLYLVLSGSQNLLIIAKKYTGCHLILKIVGFGHFNKVAFLEKFGVFLLRKLFLSQIEHKNAIKSEAIGIQGGILAFFQTCPPSIPKSWGMPQHRRFEKPAPGEAQQIKFGRPKQIYRNFYP